MNLFSCDPGFGLIMYLFSLFLIVPNLIRRFHDLDMSAWHTLLLFVPAFNIIWPILLVFFRGSKGSNRFGSDPLDQEIA